VKVFDAKTGELRHQFPHVPPVQAVAITPDGRHVAAGNLMGEIAFGNSPAASKCRSGPRRTSPSWGVIKSHHYLGGVFAMTFTDDGNELYVCGFGPMRDPMAGNGVQRWQRFSWRDGKKLDQTHEGESGQGLMEALAFHPSKKFFAMAGRLFQGKWNLAFFETSSGKNIYSTDAKHRNHRRPLHRRRNSPRSREGQGQEKEEQGRQVARVRLVGDPFGERVSWVILLFHARGLHTCALAMHDHFAVLCLPARNTRQRADGFTNVIPSRMNCTNTHPTVRILSRGNQADELRSCAAASQLCCALRHFSRFRRSAPAPLSSQQIFSRWFAAMPTR
jgi:hypothetical protein